MERLTKRNADGSVESAIDCQNGCQYITCSLEEGIQCKHECEADIYLKLAEYEDLEEQGLLLKLPCKVGDTVYSITRDFISEYNIRNFICYDNGNIFFDWKCVKGIYLNIKGFHIDDIGKTVFLTKEAAEKELERLEKDNELY